MDIPYYRPPSEEDSFLIRVMEGCPHNKCTFCGMYRGVKCRVLPLEEILQGIEKDASELGPKFLPLLTSLYLEGGDPMALPMPMLRAIIVQAKNFFPSLERIASYATVKSIQRKSLSELRELASLGLKRVHMGLESGSDDILQRTNKGCSREDIWQAADILHEVGIENDVSMMLGIGGKALSQKHALETASLINMISPACIRIRTFIPIAETPMASDVLQGLFVLMEPHQVLAELHLLVKNISAKTQLLSEHHSNFITFSAQMPEGKQKLLQLIEQAMMQPRESFRPVGISQVSA